ncbi:unnamed protein product [Ceratitis capitata]|uniref:(Mediterranean fruit fly) hypothetical protein n=1 Tax=Ceratitis capitata TaxID=7213 RepID=A0A811UDW9_CERCA|nr:unnamed protein product [Ceratitis capitata]
MYVKHTFKRCQAINKFRRPLAQPNTREMMTKIRTHNLTNAQTPSNMHKYTANVNVRATKLTSVCLYEYDQEFLLYTQAMHERKSRFWPLVAAVALAKTFGYEKLTKSGN